MALIFKFLRLSLSRLPNVPTVNYQRLSFESVIFELFFSPFEVSEDSLRGRSIVFCSEKPKSKKSKYRGDKLYDFSLRHTVMFDTVNYFNAP